ncbi:hypothetical protein OAE82_00950 [bacterium]|nr:hypothetical protein [bacterium]
MSANKQPNLKALFPDLNRAEYPSSPDGLLSSLIYPHVSKEYSSASADEAKGKWISYKRLANSNRGKIIETRPSLETRDELEQFCQKLAVCGLEIDASSTSSRTHAGAILDSIKGVAGQNAKSEITTPLSPSIAALQNPSGIFSKDGPTNYDKIFHQIASLGKGEIIKEGMLGKAALGVLQGAGQGKVTQLFDSIFAPSSKGIGPEANMVTAAHVPAWIEGLPTPFSWFSRSWDSLCEGHWINNMPTKRWCDWASCVLRTAVGLGFLWEAAFFVRLGRSILDTNTTDEEAEEFCHGRGISLLRWLPSKRRVSERHVKHDLESTMIKGLAVRRVILEEFFEDEDLPGEKEDWSNDKYALQKFIKLLRGLVKNQPDFGKRISKALSSRSTKGGDNNTKETIRFSLIQRKERGRVADFYHLLKMQSRRFMVVEPGQEWLVVIASLTAGKAGGSATLQDVTLELEKLGLKPGREHLTELLESCGLTRSFRDAEQAIEVAAAF